MSNIFYGNKGKYGTGKSRLMSSKTFFVVKVLDGFCGQLHRLPYCYWRQNSQVWLYCEKIRKHYMIERVGQMPKSTDVHLFPYTKTYY